VQNECASKDIALERERLCNQTACVQRDSFRLKLNKRLADQREKQAMVRSTAAVAGRCVVASLRRCGDAWEACGS
jgi:hypothetical protein